MTLGILSSLRRNTKLLNEGRAAVNGERPCKNYLGQVEVNKEGGKLFTHKEQTRHH